MSRLKSVAQPQREGRLSSGRGLMLFGSWLTVTTLIGTPFGFESLWHTPWTLLCRGLHVSRAQLMQALTARHPLEELCTLHNAVLLVAKRAMLYGRVSMNVMVLCNLGFVVRNEMNLVVYVVILSAWWC